MSLWIKHQKDNIRILSAETILNMFEANHVTQFTFRRK